MRGNRPFAGLGHVVQREKQISSDDKMIDIIRTEKHRKVSNLAEFERFLV
jgi:hypothetical protein